jgi:hypothetical protein
MALVVHGHGQRWGELQQLERPRWRMACVCAVHCGGERGEGSDGQRAWQMADADAARRPM